MDPISGLHRSNLEGVCALEKTDPYEELVRFIMWLTARVPYNGKRTHDVDMIRATSIRSYVSQAVTRTALETDERLVYTPKTKMLLSRLMSLPVPVLFKEPIPALVIANIIDDEGISMGTRAAIMLAWFLGGVKYFRRAVDEGDFCPVEFLSGLLGVHRAVRVPGRRAVASAPRRLAGHTQACSGPAQASRSVARIRLNLVRVSFHAYWQHDSHVGCWTANACPPQARGLAVEAGYGAVHASQ